MKIIKLIQNELTKLFSKKSTYILMTIVALMAIAPIVLNKVANDPNEDAYLQNRYSYDKYYLNQEIEKNKTSSDNKAKLMVEMAEYRLKEVDKRIQDNVGYNSWKSTLYDKLEDYDRQNFIKELENKGYSSTDIAEIEGKFEGQFGIKSTGEVETTEFTEKNIEKIRTIISNNDYSGYIALQKEEQEQQIESFKKSQENLENSLNELNKDKENNAEQITQLEKEIKDMKLNIELLKNRNEVYDYIIANKISDNDWKYKVTTDLLNSFEEIANNQSSKMNEIEYMKAQAQSEKLAKVPHEQYVKSVDLLIKQSNEDIQKDWYSLNNNIPIMQNDAKKQASNAYNNMIVIFAIIITGAIVANEFARGTIRLLLTRPVKRWKILLSKLITVLITIIVFTIISYIATILAAGILYGFSSYMVPDLVIRGGNVIAENFLLATLGKCFICLLPTLFVTSFAFMLSTVVKSSSLAVGASMGLTFAGMIANMLSLYSPKAWMQYTPIPYMDFSSFFSSNFIQIQQNNIQVGMDISLLNGSLMLIAYIAIFLIISFVTFAKTDIKNQ